uniref:Uncharacterized protein n=1 Tax=Trichogramma kaykai TaxID=54128 RepID=A0ABD2WNW6_9HYME
MTTDVYSPPTTTDMADNEATLNSISNNRISPIKALRSCPPHKHCKQLNIFIARLHRVSATRHPVLKATHLFERKAII